MDGNRRFAREIGLGNVLDGHVKGRDKLEEVLEWCLEVGVRILTVFAFSTENIRRANEEVQHLMHLFAENFRRVGDDERVHRHKIRVSVFGNRELLPPEVIEAIEYAEGRTEQYDQYRFNVAVAYGGREEILRAIRDVVLDAQAGKVDPDDVDEKFFSKRLYTADLPDPDLDEIQKTIDMPFLSGRFPTERAAPRYARFAQPLLVFVDERRLVTNLGPLTASIAVKLYGVGALAVVVRVPFQAAGLRDLRPFASLKIKDAGREENLDGYCGRLAERSATYEDTLTVFELANLQLLELRTYDAFLDKVVDKAYDDLEDLFARSSFLRSGHDTVKELAEVRMDLAEATFQVDNISKLWGDWFLGKVYRACVRKFELDSWRKIVEEKMKDLSEIYEVAQAELEARRLLILEFLVVLLFVVDVVLIAFRG